MHVARSNELGEYLQALPEERIDLFDRLRERIAVLVEVAPTSIYPFTFLPNQDDHSEWEDAAVVFWQAVQQLYLKEAATDGELPVLYWGFHSYDILARRSANGVLVTDRTVYVLDVGRSSAAIPIAEFTPGAIRVDGDALVVGEGRIGLAQAEKLLEESTAEDTAVFLSDVVATLQAELDIIAGVPATAEGPRADATVSELVRMSRLSTEFLLPERPRDAKKLAKLAAKWGIPAGETVRASLSSATLAGIYGLAITDAALYSRDLMEPLDRTELAAIASIEWVPDSQAFRIADGHLVPTLPVITDENREYFIQLLGQLVTSRG